MQRFENKFGTLVVEGQYFHLFSNGIEYVFDDYFISLHKSEVEERFVCLLSEDVINKKRSVLVKEIKLFKDGCLVLESVVGALVNNIYNVIIEYDRFLRTDYCDGF